MGRVTTTAAPQEGSRWGIWTGSGEEKGEAEETSQQNLEIEGVASP